MRDYIGKVYNKTFLESGANSEKENLHVTG